MIVHSKAALPARRSFKKTATAAEHERLEIPSEDSEGEDGRFPAEEDSHPGSGIENSSRGSRLPTPQAPRPAFFARPPVPAGLEPSSADRLSTTPILSPPAANQLSLAANQFPRAANRFPLAANRLSLAANRLSLAANRLSLAANRLSLAANRLSLAANRLSLAAGSAAIEKVSGTERG
jgi:hypothetical protein